MAVTRDASSPATSTSGNLLGNGTTSVAVSASFSPPDGTLITVQAGIDTSGPGATWSVANSGIALTWTKIYQIDNGSGGSQVGFRAYNAASQIGITVTVAAAGTANVTNTDLLGGAYVDVFTGANPDQTGAASNTGTSTSNNFNGTLTTTQTGSYVLGGALDDDGSQVCSSSDSFDAFTATAHCDGLRVYKSAASGAPGSVTVNFQTTASPIWSWGAFEILPAPNTSLAYVSHMSPGISGF